MCTWHYVFGHVMCLTPLCPHQGIEGKVMALEKKLAELIAESKPIGPVLKQLIQSLCAEEVGFVLMPHKTLSVLFFLKLVCFVYMFGPEICCFVVWPEPAACPWAEAAAWGGDDGRQLCHPHQPVLSPRQCGGGAQPEEGNVSGAGYTHSDALQTHKHEAALRPDH